MSPEQLNAVANEVLALWSCGSVDAATTTLLFLRAHDLCYVSMRLAEKMGESDRTNFMARVQNLRIALNRPRHLVKS